MNAIIRNKHGIYELPHELPNGREESNGEKSPAQQQQKCGIKECEFGPKFSFLYSAFSKF